jgi:hypothetical protein
LDSSTGCFPSLPLQGFGLLMPPLTCLIPACPWDPSLK